MKNYKKYFEIKKILIDQNKISKFWVSSLKLVFWGSVDQAEMLGGNVILRPFENRLEST